mmetsp:Transcript_19439/g.28651  ORF Transcript_19439/g.28651 Transcript_19439/m.28651 type:complete len:101 (+) Transcript_19439:746-1048(+)
MMRVSCFKLPNLNQHSRSLLSTNGSENQLLQSEESSISTVSVAMSSNSTTHEFVDHQVVRRLTNQWPNPSMETSPRRLKAYKCNPLHSSIIHYQHFNPCL